MLHICIARFDVMGTVALYEKTFRELNQGSYSGQAVKLKQSKQAQQAAKHSSHHPPSS